MSLHKQLDTKKCHQAIAKILNEIHNLPSEELSFQVYDVNNTRQQLYHDCIQKYICDLETTEQKRIQSEFNGLGPIESLFEDKNITEILLNGPNSIWFEKNGELNKHDDYFGSKITYTQFINRICQLAHCYFTVDKPTVDGKIHDFRLHLVSEELTKSNVQISLRRHPEIPWNFQKLQNEGWANENQIQILKKMIEDKENFLIVGGTGSGKTSLLNACLQHFQTNERAIIIEDTWEISLPNDVSCKLLTRKDAQGTLSCIDQTELVRQSLRMRPDRLVMGEIRGHEAKDFLMALSTGHAGSFGTLHATDAKQALLRLEMLIQLGAPYWSIDAIRSLIFLSLKKIIVVHRNEKSERELAGIFQISSKESSGILIDQLA